MGALLAVALQPYGRPGDRLSHVLVSLPFETATGFFYPPPVRRLVTVGGRHLDARQVA
jgi:CRISPR-associated protein (TIGR02584 family)